MTDMLYEVCGAGKCVRCGAEANYVSLTFEAPMCSEECDDQFFRQMEREEALIRALYAQTEEEGFDE